LSYCYLCNFNLSHHLSYHIVDLNDRTISKLEQTSLLAIISQWFEKIANWVRSKWELVLGFDPPPPTECLQPPSSTSWTYLLSWGLDNNPHISVTV